MKPGRELDRLVAAQVMGWNVAGYPPGRGTNATQSPYDTSVRDIPHYSTDIQAAWEILGRMDETGWIQFDLARSYDSRMWRAGFGTWRDGGARVEATAESAPHAICLAALKAVDRT